MRYGLASADTGASSTATNMQGRIDFTAFARTMPPLIHECHSGPPSAISSASPGPNVAFTQ
jgi:hypothetical protein